MKRVVKLKLDENLGLRAAELFRSAGHEVSTVFEQGLCSASDVEVIGVSRREDRCLVTLDLDFANPIHFPPGDYCGIAVLRLPSRSVARDIADAIQTLLAGLEHADVRGRLWVVRRGRIREYHPQDKKET